MAMIPLRDPFSDARHHMVEDQLRARGIWSEPVLAVMERIPRHLFVAPELAGQAYDDSALPSAEGQTISQPFMVAAMTESLELEPDHRVLEIGTGTGYQTAILALLAPRGRVYTIERVEGLAHEAEQRLRAMGVTNVEFHVGDGTLGWPPPESADEALPICFDRILVTAGAPAPPEPLLAQLAPDGLLVMPEGPPESQVLVALRRADGALLRRSLMHCRFVPLLGRYGWDAAEYDQLRHGGSPA